ncbi:MAG: hypothetical protein QM736_22950 [Vicinamibacterales bacterium]
MADALLIGFGVAGAAAFLTWPVYVGPPSLAAFIAMASVRGVALGGRVRRLAEAFVPLGAIAGLYLVGRLGWLQLTGTGGSAPWPSVAAYSAPLIVLGGIGALLALVRPRGRATALFLTAIGLQAVAFYVLARRAGAPQPYMALKMGYLVLWPMAGCVVLVIGMLWERSVC